jgi:RNA polymerase sigma-70 factor (ECF subfamily)
MNTMNRFSRWTGWGFLALSLLAPAATADPPSAAGFPPVVVRTFPAAGDQDVDPSLGEVRVTFSKDMLTREMWSWVRASPAPFPKIAGEIHYLKDQRTCVLPVSLEPGKTYGMWINSQEHTSFRDVYQKPAVPYLLVFKTRG